MCLFSAIDTSPAIRGSHFRIAHFDRDGRTLRNTYFAAATMGARPLQDNAAPCAGPLSTADYSYPYERRSSFSQATVKISFVVNKLYTRNQGQYLPFIYYYTKLNGRAPSEADKRA